MTAYEPNNDRLLEFAVRIQAIAQTGLAYGHDVYDRERYEQLREIAAQMMAERTDVPLDWVRDVFCNESGYQTPKVDTRAAVFEGDRILLVHERNGSWSLPGGWCDVDQSIGSNVVKEVREETGLDVAPTRFIAVQDWRRHNVRNYVYGVVKVFVQCELIGGSFEENIETIEAGWFSRDSRAAADGAWGEPRRDTCTPPRGGACAGRIGATRSPLRTSPAGGILLRQPIPRAWREATRGCETVHRA